MCFIGHAIGFEGAEERLPDFTTRGHFCKRKRLGRVLHSLEMTAQCGDSSLVYAEALPDAIAALHDAVEDRNLCVASRQYFAVNVNLDVFISWVGGLQNYSPASARMACS